MVDYEYGTLLRDSDAIVTLSGEHTKALASDDVTVEKKTWLIPPPPLSKMVSGEPSTIRTVTRARIGIAPDDFLIVYFGYIYPQKGVETLLKAFQLVLQQALQARLILIGGVVAQKYPDHPNYAEDMKALPGKLGINDRVIWIGEYATGSQEPYQYLYASDVCAFAHYHGVYLNNSSFAAAAAHGIPIIATRPPWVKNPLSMGRISYSVLRKTLKTWQAVSCVSCETRFCESGCGMDRLKSQGNGFPGRWQIHAFLKPSALRAAQAC